MACTYYHMTLDLGVVFETLVVEVDTVEGSVCMSNVNPLNRPLIASAERAKCPETLSALARQVVSVTRTFANTKDMAPFKLTLDSAESIFDAYIATAAVTESNGVPALGFALGHTHTRTAGQLRRLRLATSGTH